MDFEQLWLQHCARALDKQLAFGAIVGERDWHFNLDTGQLSFGGDLVFATQLIGTESYSSRTWLWAWANSESGIPENLLKASQKMRQFGTQHHIAALTQPEIPLDDRYNGHHFVMIASGLVDGNAYYRGPYEGGALYMVIQDSRFPAQRDHPVQRIALTFPQLISKMPVSDHREAWTHYLKSYGLRVGPKDEAIMGVHSDGAVIKATFDQQHRLTNLNTSLKKS